MVASYHLATALPFKGGRQGSDLNLQAKFDDAVRRQAEVGVRRLRVAGEQGEEPFAPARQPAPVAGDDGFAAEEECRVHPVEFQSERPAAIQNLRDILENEKKQLQAIDEKYAKQLSTTTQSPDPIVESDRRKKRESRAQAEASHRQQEEQSAEEILKKIEAGLV